MRKIEGEPEFIHMEWKQRSCGNKFARFLYKCCDVIINSVWYYFVPFTSIFLSYQIPHRYGQNPEDLVIEDPPEVEL